MSYRKYHRRFQTFASGLPDTVVIFIDGLGRLVQDLFFHFVPSFCLIDPLAGACRLITVRANKRTVTAASTEQRPADLCNVAAAWRGAVTALVFPRHFCHSRRAPSSNHSHAMSGLTAGFVNQLDRLTHKAGSWQFQDGSGRHDG